MTFIKVENLTKEYHIFKRQKGFINSLKSVVSRNYENKIAVDNINFSINKGELVGYIGPNGAGKSTTIKMLSGILLPSSGNVVVDGKVPYLNRKENALKIGVVFGQRSQLYWNLPMEETFDLYRKIYKIDRARFKENVDYYINLLEMESYLRTPVRQLSLGQRMRAELVISLLHDPDILYLDEPTIGLDVVVKQKIRAFIREVNITKEITVILTTHDMDDIEQICNRIITIDRGQIIFDGGVEQFKNKYSSGNILIVDFCEPDIVIEDRRLNIIKEEGLTKWLLFDKNEIGVAQAVTLITRNYEIINIQVKEPEIEDAVRKLYNTEKILLA